MTLLVINRPPADLLTARSEYPDKIIDLTASCVLEAHGAILIIPTCANGVSRDLHTSVERQRLNAAALPEFP